MSDEKVDAFRWAQFLAGLVITCALLAAQFLMQLDVPEFLYGIGGFLMIGQKVIGK